MRRPPSTPSFIDFVRPPLRFAFSDSLQEIRILLSFDTKGEDFLPFRLSARHVRPPPYLRKSKELSLTLRWTGKKILTNQDRTSDLEIINQLQSHALPTELW